MNELLGLAYYAEIPAVIVDVQRVGPSTGMPTRTQQGDLMEAAYASHGDTKHILLFPSNPARVLRVRSQGLRSGGALPDARVHDDRSRHRHERLGCAAPHVGRAATRPIAAACLSQEQVSQLPKFQRYYPEDENYVAARTLPGVHSKGAFFTRGSGHNKFGGYTEMPDEYQEVVDRLLQEAQGRREIRPRADDQEARGRASRHRHHRRLRSGRARSRRSARRRAASTADFMRIRGFPFDDEQSKNFIMHHDFCFVVEQNRDAQLRSLLVLETTVPKDELRSVLSYGGFPLSARHVVEPILGQVPPELQTVAPKADSNLRTVKSDSWE